MPAPKISLAAILFLIPVVAVAGEYQNLDALGLASGRGMRTRCEASAQYEGKTYCFHDENRKAQFLSDPAGNREKAESFYQSKSSDPNWTPCDYSLPPSEPNSCN